MPQFDPTFVPAQLFWLAVLFGLLWLILARAGLPRVERIFEDRERRIANDLDMAERLNNEAEQVRGNYEQRLAEARASAQEIIAGTRDEVARHMAKADADLNERLTAGLDEAEARIAQAQAEALGEVETMARTAAHDLVGRLLGSVDEDQVNKALASAIAEQEKAA